MQSQRDGGLRAAAQLASISHWGKRHRAVRTSSHLRNGHGMSVRAIVPLEGDAETPADRHQTPNDRRSHSSLPT
jgi:hypothetical protein